ncbi:hypothetical protein SERLA73DRAFT_181086 [Serpula lacrymans var. lacrymans S7.3]|uniref:Adenylate kinase n=2 Tax=Serpula lacrymans var. lacrymans TaxID=341189 RepID=F8PUR8_SERL3|nr:uncharacterized protein SERLADRAFT_466971 [Serpula lacrymans var. lacrymans S7.9]EGO00476.1 hypothetical protein SERLA73DRAFT_181086 [Serpula lacrymans var. lacrymans S7.3]EGO26028.1 hypothetical protein SERLADRAFT_466971 [Serpula lacrymans var. lacrymans S7.9]
MEFPPLLGDGQGRYRVHIVGNSGSGKSTLGASLAAILGIPYICLDRLFWGPGWEETPQDEFYNKLITALGQDEKGWVVDGNYSQCTANLHEQCTDIIWLDPPLLLYFPRLCIRTFLRILNVREPCSPGCNETISHAFFSEDNIIWWCLSSHWRVRRKNKENVRNPAIGGKMRRIGGWGNELMLWKRAVEEMVRRT